MKKVLIIITGIFLIFCIVLIVKYVQLKHSNEVPYSNLTHFGTASFYIFFDISYKGQKHTVIYSNTKLRDLILQGKRKVFSPFYSLWLNEVIKHNWSIKLKDQMFSQLKYGIVEKKFVEKHLKNLTKDKIILKGSLPDHITVNDFNALIYILLNNGINCRTNSETGDTEVIIPQHLLKKVDWEDFKRSSSPDKLNISSEC